MELYTKFKGIKLEVPKVFRKQPQKCCQIIILPWEKADRIKYMEDKHIYIDCIKLGPGRDSVMKADYGMWLWASHLTSLLLWEKIGRENIIYLYHLELLEKKARYKSNE